MVAVRIDARAVDHPSEHADEEYAEKNPAGINAVRVRFPTTSTPPGQIWIPPLALGSQHEAILHAAAALEDVVVVGPTVAFAHDLGAAQFQCGRQRRRARPLDVLVTVACALVLAAHHVDLVQAADFGARDAGQLRHRRHPAVRRLGAAATQGQRLDLREEDGVFGLCGRRGWGGGREEEEPCP